MPPPSARAGPPATLPRTWSCANAALMRCPASCSGRWLQHRTPAGPVDRLHDIRRSDRTACLGPPILSLFKALNPLAIFTTCSVHHDRPPPCANRLEAKGNSSQKPQLRCDGASLGSAGSGCRSQPAAAPPARLTRAHPRRGGTVVAVGSGPPVTVTGEPQELLLFAFGRNAVHVDFSGDDDVVAAVQAAKRGF